MKPMGWVNVAGVLVLVSGTLMVYWHWEWVVSSAGESGSAVIRNLGIVYGGLIAIWVAIWRGFVADRHAEASKLQAQASLDQAKAAQDQAETSQRGLLNERYQRGAEMLGSPVLSVRLGGIYALQHLAEDEPTQYHVQTMRLLCAFVLNPRKDEDLELRPVRQPLTPWIRDDVQAAMRAISNRSDGDIELEKKESFRLDLINVQLDDADLSKANLTDANLAAANLKGANLRNAILANANLAFANLTGTDLSEAVGVTQAQLAHTCADSDNPPKLHGLCDAETDLPLEWRGKPCGT